MYRKCIHKFPPCYDIKYSTKFWNVTTYTKPCCKKCIALFCNYILSIIQAPTSATPYTLPITSNQKLLIILVTRSILNCPCSCSGSVLYIANCYCYIRFLLCFLINHPLFMLWFCSVYRKSLLLHKISFMLFNKLSMLMFWFCSVYRKSLLLHKISLMLFNKLTTFIPYVRIVYRKMPLLL